MIIWINGAFGSGKTTTANMLHRRLPNSFIYDPENVGYFIRQNTGKLFLEGDFQDIPLWREMNYKTLSAITQKYDGVVIVPMTLVNPGYYNEIVGKLVSDGVDVRHYILYASRDEIRLRLRRRSFFGLRNEDFALDAVDRCVDAFDNYITDTKIHVSNMNAYSVVEEILRLSKLQLS